MRDLRGRLEALPGVTGVTAANPLPLDPRESLARYGHRGGARRSDEVRPGHGALRPARVLRRDAHANGRGPHVHRGRQPRRDARGRHRPGAGGEALSGAVGARSDGAPAGQDARARALQGHRCRRAPASRLARARRARGGISAGGICRVWRGESMGRAHERRSGDALGLGQSRRHRGESARRRHRRPADARVCRARAGADEVRARADWRLCRYRARPGGGWPLQRAVHRPSASARRRSACAWPSAPSTAGSSA